MRCFIRVFLAPTLEASCSIVPRPRLYIWLLNRVLSQEDPL
jgi:hypothetical protein